MDSAMGEEGMDRGIAAVWGWYALAVLVVASQAASLVAVTLVPLRISLKASSVAQRAARDAPVRRLATISAST